MEQKNKKQIKSERVYIRLTKNEKQALQNNAQKNGQTMSDYVKSKTLKNNK